MDKEYIAEHNGVKYVKYDSLENTGLVYHGFMTRVGGVSSGPFGTLNLGFNRGDDEKAVAENYKRAAACFAKSPDRVVLAHQTHTSVIRRVTQADAGMGVVRDRDFHDVDGLITNEPGILLATSHADCTPIFLLDPENRAIGMVHSGWKGTVGLIGVNAVRAMEKEFGTDPSQLIAVIGPCICKNCYEIGQEVAVRFMEIFGGERFALQKKDNGKYMLDLKRANKRILFEAGLREFNIVCSEICTFERDDLFYSHRRMGAERGQMLAFIGLK